MFDIFYLQLYFGGCLIMAFLLHLFKINTNDQKLSDSTILIWSLLWFITAPFFGTAIILGIVYGVISSIIDVFKNKK